MPVTISSAQQDAIYELAINRLNAIGDVQLCVDRREYASARRLGREVAEDLRLLEDLRAVDNCLTRLATAGRARQISDKPRR